MEIQELVNCIIGLPIWALARESHAALAVVDETLWFVIIRNCVII